MALEDRGDRFDHVQGAVPLCRKAFRKLYGMSRQSYWRYCFLIGRGERRAARAQHSHRMGPRNAQRFSGIEASMDCWLTDILTEVGDYMPETGEIHISPHTYQRYNTIYKSCFL